MKGEKGQIDPLLPEDTISKSPALLGLKALPDEDFNHELSKCLRFVAVTCIDLN